MKAPAVLLKLLLAPAAVVGQAELLEVVVQHTGTIILPPDLEEAEVLTVEAEEGRARVEATKAMAVGLGARVEAAADSVGCDSARWRR